MTYIQQHFIKVAKWDGYIKPFCKSNHILGSQRKMAITDPDIHIQLSINIQSHDLAHMHVHTHTQIQIRI